MWKFDDAMCYQTQMPFTFVIFFSDIGQCFFSLPKQRVSKINMSNMSNKTAGYRRFSGLTAFFGNSHILIHVWNIMSSSNFYKFCVKAEVLRWKMNLWNHLWLHSGFLGHFKILKFLFTHNKQRSNFNFLLQTVFLYKQSLKRKNKDSIKDKKSSRLKIHYQFLIEFNGFIVPSHKIVSKEMKMK